MEETNFVTNAFENLAKKRKKLKVDKLVRSWGKFADPEYLSHLEASLINIDKAQKRVITIMPFEYYFYVVIRASVVEKCIYITEHVFGSSEGITLENIRKFVSSVLRSYFLSLKYNATEQYKSWRSSDASVKEYALDLYAGFLVEDLPKSQPITINDLMNWMDVNALWVQLWQTVVLFLYEKSAKTAMPPDVHITHLSTLPFCDTSSRDIDEFPTILDFGKIMFLHDQLRMNQRNNWRLLFSSQIHGASFTTLVDKIIEKGPTLIVVRDKHNYMFGGYAPEEWTLGPKFFGNDTAMLFMLEPTMKIFLSTGYNDHYQYLNMNQQTIPNGLGMGGQFGYWGLWLDYDYGIGQSSETCTTFRNYVQLSRHKDFRVVKLEVWSVGDRRSSETEDDDDDDDDNEGNSILDYKYEAQTILAVVGVQLHSQGLKNPNA